MSTGKTKGADQVGGVLGTGSGEFKNSGIIIQKNGVIRIRPIISRTRKKRSEV